MRLTDRHRKKVYLYYVWIPQRFFRAVLFVFGKMKERSANLLCGDKPDQRDQSQGKKLKRHPSTHGKFR